MSSLARAVSLALLLGAAGQAVAADHGGAISRALSEIQQNAAATRLSSYDAFTANAVTVDRNGAEHVRFRRTYRGLPVIGGDLVVHSIGGVFSGASLTQARAITIGVTPRVSASTAIELAGVKFGTGFDIVPTAHLAVFARRATPLLAYDVLFVGTRKDGTPTRMHYMVDALSGAILDHWDAVETGVLPRSNTIPPTATVGSGRSLSAGTVVLNTQLNAYTHLYELKDPTRGGTYITDIHNGFRGNGTLMVDGDNNWGNGTTSDRTSAGVDAAYGFARTWDFYKANFGRIGIANDGRGAFGAVHFATSTSGYENAFWSNDCFCMAFGDGDGVHTKPFTAAIDVMGHEMTHGVTYATANLAYSGESGGLNEATSDIMGTMVEFYANNAKQPPNYLIGENLFTSDPSNPPALRTMFKPNLDGISDDCYPDGSDPAYLDFFSNWKDPHYTSGVANHFYYLLAEGAVVPAGWGSGTSWNLTSANLVCNGNTAIAGIGRAAAQQIWYRALTLYMTSGTNYAGARVATMTAAGDLYGVNSARQQAVAAAWDAVNVH